jgi:hypothetical protein
MIVVEFAFDDILDLEAAAAAACGDVDFDSSSSPLVDDGTSVTVNLTFKNRKRTQMNVFHSHKK